MRFPHLTLLLTPAGKTIHPGRLRSAPRGEWRDDLCDPVWGVRDQSSRRIMPEMAAAAMAVTSQPATMKIF